MVRNGDLLRVSRYFPGLRSIHLRYKNGGQDQWSSFYHFKSVVRFSIDLLTLTSSWRFSLLSV